jgi:ATP-dependent DNA helicase RecG
MDSDTRLSGSLSAEGCCATIPSRMQAPTESSQHTPLQEWLDRIARPIEFASRDAGAHLRAVANLSSFISSQILSALRQAVYPKAIEARLISLRDLFVDFHPALPLAEQRRRLQTATLLIKALRAVDQQKLIRRKDLPTPASCSSKVTSAGRSDLWNFPVRFVKGVGPKRTTVLQRLHIGPSRGVTRTDQL